jgi:hypothetical protein
MKAQFRGIFLTSEKPALTARFYEQVGGLPLEKVGHDDACSYWRMDDGRLQFALHDAKLFADYTHPVTAGSNTTHLYFKIEDQQAFLRHLKSLNVEPYAVDDVVVTVEDPDGRKVMFGTA